MKALINRIIVNSILVIACSLVYSCEDILEESPKSIAVETFYNTLSEAETAVNAIYLPIGENLHNGEIGINSVLSEFTYGRGSWAALNSYTGLNDTWKTRISGRWTSDYLAIRNANIVIGNLPSAPALDQDDKDRLVAEAKFLRAFVYFQLVRNWGGVPIRTEENIFEINLARSSEDEVYDFIIGDLLDAEEALPDEPRLIGTPSVWAAKTLLADVYLHLEMYTEASTKSNEVINSGQFALVPVNSTDDFQNIFGADVVTTNEEIFYSRFSHVSGQGNVWPGLMAHPATGLYGTAGVYGVYSLSSNLAYQAWDDDDFRKGQWFSWDIGVGPNTLLSMKFIDPGTPGLTGGASPVTWYRYADVLLIFSEANARSNNSPTAAAVEAINQVHRRAYGYDPLSASPMDFNAGDYDLSGFLDLIVQERGYEFELEGKRWLDLKRLNKAQDVISTIKGEDVPQLNYLWPIPINEFNFNLGLDPNTDQNPGY
ncbi:MAG: RagB/SusD family nutrient uptake outer membrane protein [Cyclobacteriaceae bacterium]|nr:RagB/SusD family nutrient uptake outer membrane protein [Cyclobacteriaceae bacterium SS2]